MDKQQKFIYISFILIELNPKKCMGFIKQSFNFIAMKKITILLIPAFIALFSFGGSHAVAQKAEKTNVKKELNQILKELSEEEQLKILKYAQKR
ncbi:MAG: hypothetical protein KDD63_15035, partial [Bacteroidetes bacterium]|nr:hypothetical protein [Bacteroidota bacterium]